MYCSLNTMKEHISLDQKHVKEHYPNIIVHCRPLKGMSAERM